MKEKKIDALIAQSLAALVESINNMQIQKDDIVTIMQNSNNEYILFYYS